SGSRIRRRRAAHRPCCHYRAIELTSKPTKLCYARVRMRRASNILMATLIVAALFFGNCLSCPQMLTALASQQPGHGCCHHKTAKIDCHSQLLSHFVKAQGGNAAPALATSSAAPAIEP